MGQCVTLMFEILHNAVWGLEVEVLCDFLLSFFGNMVGHYYYFSLFICLLFFARSPSCVIAAILRYGSSLNDLIADSNHRTRNRQLA